MASENAPVGWVVSSTPPFQTKEPERYQAVRIITSTAPGAEPVVTRNSIARDGQMRRDEFETNGSKTIAYLDLPNGRFMLLPVEKIYADLNGQDRGVVSPDQQGTENSTERLLHSEPINTLYQKLGSELINGRSSSKYRVVVNTSAAAAVSNSETLIWIDDDLGMPVKSETTSADGTRTTMEVSEVSREVNQSLFQIPEGFEKVEARIIRQRLRRND